MYERPTYNGLQVVLDPKLTITMEILIRTRGFWRRWFTRPIGKNFTVKRQVRVDPNPHVSPEGVVSMHPLTYRVVMRDACPDCGYHMAHRPGCPGDRI